MMLPLFVLAVGAFAAGYLNWPSEKLGEFLGESPSFKLAHQVAVNHFGDVVEAASLGQHKEGETHAAVNVVMILSGLIAMFGIFVAYSFHLRDRMKADRLAAGMPAVTRLLEAKYWVDEIYQNVIIEPLRGAGRVLFNADRMLIDGTVSAISWVPQLGGWVLKLGVQRGSLQGYAAAMLFGVVVILLLVFL